MKKSDRWLPADEFAVQMACRTENLRHLTNSRPVEEEIDRIEDLVRMLLFGESKVNHPPLANQARKHHPLEYLTLKRRHAFVELFDLKEEIKDEEVVVEDEEVVERIEHCLDKLYPPVPAWELSEQEEEGKTASLESMKEAHEEHARRTHKNGIEWE